MEAAEGRRVKPCCDAIGRAGLFGYGLKRERYSYLVLGAGDTSRPTALLGLGPQRPWEPKRVCSLFRCRGG